MTCGPPVERWRSPIPRASTQTPGQTQASQGAMGQGKIWTDEENEALGRAWLHASENPIVGKDQSGPKFWEKVHERFVHLLPSSNRSGKALKVRWTTLQREVAKFCGVYSRLKSAQPSGSVEADVRELACEQYANEVHLPFKLISSWEVLRGAPKFTETIALKQCSGAQKKKTGKKQDREDAKVADDLPIGTKKAKQEAEKRALRLREVSYIRQLVRQSKHRNDMLRDHIGLHLFSKPPPDDQEAADYHTLLRRKYLRQLEAETKELEEKGDGDEESKEEPSILV